MIKISCLNCDSENSTSDFTDISLQDNTYKYVFKDENYIVKFSNDNISISNSLNTPKKKQRFRDYFKKQSNVTDEVNYSNIKNPILVSFVNSESKSMSLLSNKLILIDIFPNIDLKVSPLTKGLLADFIFKSNSYLSDIKFNLSDFDRFSVDSSGNLLLTLTNFTFKLNAPKFKNKIYKFIISDNFASLDTEEDSTDASTFASTIIEKSLHDSKDMGIQPYSRAMDFAVLSNPPQPVYPVGERTLLIKVEKTKFDYLYSKADNILCCPNLGIVNDLYVQEEIKYSDYPLVVKCSDTSSKTVITKVPYKNISYKTYISYSVAIYNFDNSTTLPSTPITACYDGLYIYALENDNFVGNDISVCSGINDTPLKAVDYDVVLSATCELLPDTTLTDYFVYSVTVKIGITKAPPINDQVDQNTLDDLNSALGRDPGSTAPITRGDLQTITALNLSNSGQSGLSILIYTPNLTTLEVDSAGVSDITSLQATPNLQSLIMPGNAINDLSVLKYLPALTNLNVSDNQIDNLGPISNLTQLETLDTSSNDVSSLLPLNGLTSLITLNVANNTLTSLSGLEHLTNLTYLDASNNSIGSLLPISGLTQITSLIITRPAITTFAMDILSDPTKISDIGMLVNFTELVTLDLSGNAITDISPLQNLTKLVKANILNQDIILETPIQPDTQGEYELNVAFLEDIDALPPTIVSISNNGYCINPDSAHCTTIIWPSSEKGKTVSFTFSSDISLFTGKVTVTLSQVS